MSAEQAKAVLIHKALKFAFWAAGEGLCPAPEERSEAPEDFLFEYATAAQDEDWETFADRLAPLLQPPKERGE